MHPTRRTTAAAAVLATVTAVALAAPSPATADPAGERRAPDIQGEARASAAADNRRGAVEPTARQRNLADQVASRVRWNDFGTPAVLVPAPGEALATGLPADPEAAARAYVRGNRDLLGLTPRAVDSLELLSLTRMGQGAAVVLRQRFGGLPAAAGGLVSLAVRDGEVVFLTSSLARDAAAPPAPGLDRAAAVTAAARDASLPASSLERARLMAVPTPRDGVRPAWQVVLIDNDAAEPHAVTSYVDARTGDVLVRDDLVDHAADNPEWEVFPANPPLDYASTDTRQTWCWSVLAGCERVVGNDAAGAPWDVDQRTGTPTHTSIGNAARTFEKWYSNDSRVVGTTPATPRPNRDYVYPWTNQWYEQRCNPAVFTSPERNDIDAAIANLFAMHNRMHDWSYELGFTEATWNLQAYNHGRGGAENDPEQGNAQAGGVTGGPPLFQARDNANQITPPDGIAPTTNMYLWQPIAAAFYAPCVDGDYDMSVIGHEYTHAISNRMVAGPDGRLSGGQAGAMGESWSDLTAVEYLNAYDFVPTGGENPYAVGPYVTGDKQAGIRNYGMNVSPLNYSDVGYDLTGPQVHADGEIWSATNFAIREAMDARYGAGDAAARRACADGETPVGQCPGSRRWIQLVFDAYLLMASGDVSMVDARDAMLAADRARFGGANQDLLWNVFASRGLGEDASSAGHLDGDPKPGFASPHATESVLTFKTAGDATGSTAARLYVGDYEGRVTPVADTDPATALPDTVRMVAGTYRFIAVAPGFGATRLTQTVKAGQVRDLPVNLRRNHASAASGAVASGDGRNLDKLIDDTEATNWASLGQPVEGRTVTVDLGGDTPVEIRRVQVSAMLRPTNSTDPGGDTGGQSRYSALRSFEVLACSAGGEVTCSSPTDFRRVYASPADAFPAVAPRPRVPDLIMRSFTIPSTSATHLQLRVVTNQCTGAPDYAGDHDDDPANVTDCSAGSIQDNNVRAAEFQAFSR